MKDKKYEIHVISNTHWDREWTYPFQETRMRLVSFLDELFSIFDKEPRYKSYLMDAQVIPIEDYLAVRPEMTEKVKKYVKNGRLLVGPWYTLPEENIVNGESLVRNLLVGHRVSQKFGKTMKIGYTPFSYGQISQMPQIYRNFGIDTLIFYRGISADEADVEFIVEGADGSRVTGSRLGPLARYDFFFYVYRPVILGRKYGDPASDREYKLRQKGLPFHLCNEDSYMQHYYLLDPVRGFNKETLRKAVQALKQLDAKTATTKYLLFMSGHDSTEPDIEEIRLISEAAKVLKNDKIFHSSFPEYIAKLKKSAKHLKVLKGERRNPARHTHLFGDVLSSRVRIKQANSKTERALQRWAEPFATAAWTLAQTNKTTPSYLNKQYPQSVLEIAWKYLMKCHPHDTISGAGVDKIERDALYNYDQSLEISGDIMRRSLQDIVLNIDNSDLKQDESSLVLFNPSSHPRDEVVSVFVDIPAEKGRSEFQLVDPCGNTVPLQTASCMTAESIVRHGKDAPLFFLSNRSKVHFIAKEVPAMGYKTFKIIPEVPSLKDQPQQEIITASNVMENQYLKILVKENGALQITDKRTEQTYDNMNYFEDLGESGNAWMHALPKGDREITSLKASAKITRLENGPILATYKIVTNLLLPESLTADRKRRSPVKKNFRITSLVTLKKNCPYVDIVTRFNNTIKDHRLRAVFPAGIKAKTSCADVGFDVVERPIDLTHSSPYFGDPNPTHPNLDFVDLNDGKQGLAVLNEGLREYEIKPRGRIIALTLIRSYMVSLCTVSGRWEDHPEMKLSQSPGEHEFHYAIYPHPGGWEKAEIHKVRETFSLPAKAAQCAEHCGALPKSMSFFSIEPAQLVLSTIKKAQDRNSIILRLYNPTTNQISGKMSFYKKIKKAWLVNMNEEQQKSVRIKDNNIIRLKVPGKKIITIELETI